MINLIKMGVSFFRRIKQKVELNKYNGGTIAEYFRKQGAQIGEGCWLEVKSIGVEPFLVKIGNNVAVAPNVQFFTHDAAVFVLQREIGSVQRFGKIEVFDNCFIGSNTIILPNITIGPNSIVAAGSVVTKSVPPNTIVGGNPAKPIGSVEEYKKKVIQIWGEQKPPGYLKEIEDGKDYGVGFSLVPLKIRDRYMLTPHLIKMFWGDTYQKK